MIIKYGKGKIDSVHKDGKWQDVKEEEDEKKEKKKDEKK